MDSKAPSQNPTIRYTEISSNGAGTVELRRASLATGYVLDLVYTDSAGKKTFNKLIDESGERDWATKSELSGVSAALSVVEDLLGAASPSGLPSTNLNSCRINATCAISSQYLSQYTNLPINEPGIFRSTVCGSYCLHEYFAVGHAYSRVYISTGWSQWIDAA